VVGWLVEPRDTPMATATAAVTHTPTRIALLFFMGTGRDKVAPVPKRAQPFMRSEIVTVSPPQSFSWKERTW
jgi:hypothetical protein